MHIPDNFLSPSVWATLDALAVPAVGVMMKRAARDLEPSRVPLLGVMGAFVFAAQMINFPVGVGTSGHLVGGALLAWTLGVAPAALVMTAILTIQAFVFQDGGVLALGANIVNMAIAGVLASYAPYLIWSGAKRRKIAIFAGAFLSVAVSASLALSELLISGVRMSSTLLLLSVALFAVSALIEGAITVSVMGALEKLNPRFVATPQAGGRRAVAALGAAAVVLATSGFLLASAAPDGIERLAADLGLSTRTVFHAPLADYSLGSFQSGWVRRAAAALSGLLLIYAICALAAKRIGRAKERLIASRPA